MGQRPPETVELPHHQAIARLEEGQRLSKAGAIVATAAGAIFEQLPLIDSRSAYVRKSPVERFPYIIPFRHKFVVQLLAL
jgi:hypothetical protein